MISFIGVTEGIRDPRRSRRAQARVHESCADRSPLRFSTFTTRRRHGPHHPLAMPRVIAGCLALAALSLLLPSEPSYDPWAWIVWGREIAFLELDTTGGPSWKPLPVAVHAGLRALRQALRRAAAGAVAGGRPRGIPAGAGHGVPAGAPAGPAERCWRASAPGPSPRSRWRSARVASLRGPRERGAAGHRADAMGRRAAHSTARARTRWCWASWRACCGRRCSRSSPHTGSGCGWRSRLGGAWPRRSRWRSRCCGWCRSGSARAIRSRPASRHAASRPGASRWPTGRGSRRCGRFHCGRRSPARAGSARSRGCGLVAARPHDTGAGRRGGALGLSRGGHDPGRLLGQRPLLPAGGGAGVHPGRRGGSDLAAAAGRPAARVTTIAALTVAVAPHIGVRAEGVAEQARSAERLARLHGELAAAVRACRRPRRGGRARRAAGQPGLRDQARVGDDADHRRGGACDGSWSCVRGDGARGRAAGGGAARVAEPGAERAAPAPGKCS